MGFKMKDIHSPTVPSGTVSSSASSHGKSTEDLTLDELMRTRTRVENELWALGSVLESHGVNMNTSLTTFDGFPRADIDVAQIRTTRSKIVRLRNDYKSLTDRIELGLQAHFANGAPNGIPPSSSGFSRASSSLENASAASSEFARVNAVSAGSPADEAGLRFGDLIKQFGNVNSTNNEKLGKVAEEVAQNEQREIKVVVHRFSAEAGQMRDAELTLIPRKDWGGRGALGCHLVPI